MTQSDILDMVHDTINAEGTVEICGMTFDRSVILRECDPTAYRIVINECIDSMIADLEYDQDHLDPEVDMDEHQEIQERIDELENAYI